MEFGIYELLRTAGWITGKLRGSLQKVPRLDMGNEISKASSLNRKSDVQLHGRRHGACRRVQGWTYGPLQSEPKA
jgi:hypothetical protein